MENPGSCWLEFPLISFTHHRGQIFSLDWIWHPWDNPEIQTILPVVILMSPELDRPHTGRTVLNLKGILGSAGLLHLIPVKWLQILTEAGTEHRSLCKAEANLAIPWQTTVAFSPGQEVLARAVASCWLDSCSSREPLPSPSGEGELGTNSRD